MNAIVITQEMRDAAEAIAKELGVTPHLHPNDHMLRFICATNKEDGVERYFRGGQNAAARMSNVVKKFHPNWAEPIKLLDFASGYGRVIRHTKQFSGCEVHAADIHPEACDFLENSLGVTSHLSSADPAKLDIGSGYDFVYVISLFSHLPDRTFGAWLKALYGVLAPGGCLLFSTNGSTTYARSKALYDPFFDSEKGFSYVRKSDQLDLDTEDYGAMLVTLPYMARVFEEFVPDAKLLQFEAASWGKVQDGWVITKPM